MSCSEFSEFLHWANRCDITLSLPSISADAAKIYEADKYIVEAMLDENLQGSDITHLSVCRCDNTRYMADLITYVAICKYCKNIGFYNGVYKLNFAKYVDEIKSSWSSKYPSDHLDDMRIWISSAKYLIIYNIGLVKFNDFEAQTMLSMFQERYGTDKVTIVVTEKSKKYSLLGKSGSVFYEKLKRELSLRGGK